MKNFLLTLLLISFQILLGQSLPKSQVFTLEGNSIEFSNSIDSTKVTVLTFWATWCSPCKKELDNLEGLYGVWMQKYNVEIVAVSIDDARSVTKVKPLVESRGWPYRILLDKNEDLRRALNFQNVPYTFIIKDGQIVFSHSGYLEGDEWDMDEFLDQLCQ